MLPVDRTKVAIIALTVNMNWRSNRLARHDASPKTCRQWCKSRICSLPSATPHRLPYFKCCILMSTQDCSSSSTPPPNTRTKLVMVPPLCICIFYLSLYTLKLYIYYCTYIWWRGGGGDETVARGWTGTVRTAADWSERGSFLTIITPLFIQVSLYS